MIGVLVAACWQIFCNFYLTIPLSLVAFCALERSSR